MKITLLGVTLAFLNRPVYKFEYYFSYDTLSSAIYRIFVENKTNIIKR